MTEDALPPVVRSLVAAVEANPGDFLLRLHVAEVMLQHDLPALAARQCSEVLAKDPTDTEALRLLGVATEALRGGPGEATVDWQAMEEEVSDRAPPAFVEGDAAPDILERTQNPDVIQSAVRLDDVGGMSEVKRRLEMAFLTPMNNPELRKLYGRSLQGGLLLYGPPGCGKTFHSKSDRG